MAERNLKKTAYAAIGVPVHYASQARERLADLLQSLEDVRERLSEDAQDALEAWINEGEQLVSSLTDRVSTRRTEVEETIRSGAATARDVGRGVAATLTEPIVSVEMIDGVGPSYAKKLATAGVLSTRALVERCSSNEAIERLAAQAGISAALLEKWVPDADLTRISGIGHEYMSLLNGAGVATVRSLAEQNAERLEGRVAELNEVLGLVASLPSTTTLSNWIDQAKKLAASS